METAIRAEMGSAFYYFDAIYVVDGGADGGKRMEEQLARLGLPQRASRTAAIQSAESRGTARVLSHRHILEQAKKQALEHVLVVDDPEQLSERAVAILERRVGDLRTHAWQILHVGDPSVERRAVAYHRTVYDSLLGRCPTAPDLEEWFATCVDTEPTRSGRVPG